MAVCRLVSRVSDYGHIFYVYLWCYSYDCPAGHGLTVHQVDKFPVHVPVNTYENFIYSDVMLYQLDACAWFPCIVLACLSQTP